MQAKLKVAEKLYHDYEMKENIAIQELGGLAGPVALMMQMHSSGNRWKITVRNWQNISCSGM